MSAAASDAGAADDAVLVHLRFVCPPDAESIVLQAGFVGVATASAEGETHRHLAHVVVVGPPRRELDTVLAAGHERIEIAASGDADAGRAGGFFALLETGIRHVLGGPDHLAFLLALVLESSGAGGLAELLRVATAFTVAHSLTLALATTGLARPPSSWIEPLVALSIAVVAARAVRQTRADRPAPRRSGWPLAFGFGLVHGFAFADALRTLGLHGLALARSLVGFNLGVEAGQLVALAVLVPALAGVSRLVGDRARVVRVVGALLVLVGVVWFVARLRTSFAW